VLSDAAIYLPLVVGVVLLGVISEMTGVHRPSRSSGPERDRLLSLGIHTNVLLAIGGVFGTLVLATLIVWLLERSRPAANLGELESRVRSWWVC